MLIKSLSRLNEALKRYRIDFWNFLVYSKSVVGTIALDRPVPCCEDGFLRRIETATSRKAEGS